MRTNNARRFVLPALIVLLGWREPTISAQLAPPEKTIPLYEGAAPGSETWTWTERASGSAANPTIQNVVHPELMYYPADKSKFVGTTMIVAPGGGFQNLMMSYEGVDIAKRLNEMGIDAFVLKYRLKHQTPAPRGSRGAATTQPADPHANDEIQALAGADGQQAIRLLRQHVADYNFKHLGFIGFSAGGRVAVSVLRGPAETRPDFAALIYAGGASGDAPPPGAPPLFLAVAADDQSVGYQGSLDMFSAWRKANVPVELHIFQSGRHGLRVKGFGGDHFMDRVEEWMKGNGWLGK
jgi:dienelactone hydrolase